MNDPNSVPAADRNGQLITALATVVVLGIIGIGLLIVVGWKDSLATTGFVALGTIVGVLGNSLNAPTGIGNVLRATNAPSKPAPDATLPEGPQ